MKQGYIQRLKRKIQALLEARRREKEEKKKKAEAIRIWCMQNPGTYLKRTKIICLNILCFFSSLWKSADIKQEKIHIDSVKTTKKLRIEYHELKKIEKEVKEDEPKSLETQKPSVLIQKKETWKQKKEKVAKKKKEYEEVDTTFIKKSIPENVVLLSENKKLSQNIITKIDNKIKKIDSILENKKRNMENVSLKKEKKEKKIIEKKGSKPYVKADTVVTNVKLDVMEKMVEKDMCTKELTSLLVTLEKINKKGAEAEAQERIFKNQKIVLEKLRKEEKRKNKKARTEDDLAEIVFMETMIYNQIKKQKKEIEKIRKKISALHIVEKKKGLFSILSSFLRRSMKLAFSLFPLAIFKNKKMGLLTSSILVNNSIRSMRTAISKKEIPYIEFEKVASLLRKSEEELEETKLVCFDSLDQIAYLRNEFLQEFGYESSAEIDAILKEMNQLENMIKSRTKELAHTKEEIVKVKKGANQKIKKLESIYGKN